MNDEIETLENSNQDMVSVLQDKDEFLSLVKNQFSELWLAMQERENQVKDLSKKINESDKAIAAKSLKQEQYI